MLPLCGGGDYFYCDYCEQYHWALDGYKSNMVIIGDCDIVCRNCMTWAENKDWELVQDYIDHLINNPHVANEYLTNQCLESFGFKKVDTMYDCGLYRHNRNDNPEKILEHYELEGYDVIFNIETSTPYETEFTVYIKEAR